MNDPDVELLEKKTCYQGFFRIDQYRLRHRLHNGGQSPELVREVFDRGQVVAVLLLDPDRDAVVLIEQFRAGAYAADWEPWLVECVAGIVDPGETCEQVAKRETLEESGCRVIELVPMLHYLSTPGASTETVTTYCGRVDSQGIGGVHGLAAEGEDIKVSVVPVDRAFEMLSTGKIVNAMTIIALQWLALNYDRLKTRWR